MHVQEYTFKLITDKFTSGVWIEDIFLFWRFNVPVGLFAVLLPLVDILCFHTVDPDLAEVAVQRSEPGIQD